MKESVHEMLADSLRRHAAAEAFVAAGRPSLSYEALGRQFERDHAFLRRAGFGPRARIGVAMPSGPEGLAVIGAIARSAACAHFEPDLDLGSLAGLMSAMHLDAVIVPEAAASNAARAARAAAVPLIELVAPAGAAAGEHELRTAARRDPVPADLPGPDDLAFLWHTSGTSGRPKIVPLEQWRICFDVRKRIDRRRIGSTDRCLIASTMSSAATTRAVLLSNLAAGAAVLHAGEMTAESILNAIESLAPTYFVAPPALYSRLLELADRRGAGPRHRLRVVYSSFAEQPAEARAALERRLGVPMVVSYGMTEVGGITETPMPPEVTPAGSVGKPVLDLAIAGDDGSFLGPDGHGEVCVRGPEVMAGYEGPAQANREAFHDGWFRTGDSGYLDRRGFLHLTGRIKDIINRGGVKISPSEVELALAAHPAVREAAVFARRHATLGEDVCAAVVFESGRGATEAELRRFVRHRLSAAKVPSRIIAAGALPRNASGKLQRTELSGFGETLLAQSRQPPQGDVERQLAGIFNEVLRVDDIGRDDAFFDRGGDSLRAVEAIERIRERFGVSLSMDAFLENPSVAAVALRVSDTAGASGTTPH